MHVHARARADGGQALGRVGLDVCALALLASGHPSLKEFAPIKTVTGSWGLNVSVKSIQHLQGEVVRDEGLTKRRDMILANAAASYEAMRPVKHDTCSRSKPLPALRIPKNSRRCVIQTELLL